MPSLLAASFERDSYLCAVVICAVLCLHGVCMLGLAEQRFWDNCDVLVVYVN